MGMRIGLGIGYCHGSQGFNDALLLYLEKQNPLPLFRSPPVLQKKADERRFTLSSFKALLGKLSSACGVVALEGGVGLWGWIVGFGRGRL